MSHKGLWATLCGWEPRPDALQEQQCSNYWANSPAPPNGVLSHFVAVSWFCHSTTKKFLLHCVCVCVCIYAIVYMWMSKYNIQESVLSFHYVGPRTEFMYSGLVDLLFIHWTLSTDQGFWFILFNLSYQKSSGLLSWKIICLTNLFTLS